LSQVPKASSDEDRAFFLPILLKHFVRGPGVVVVGRVVVLETGVPGVDSRVPELTAAVVVVVAVVAVVVVVVAGWIVCADRVVVVGGA
jgi:hypothetical protein